MTSRFLRCYFQFVCAHTLPKPQSKLQSQSCSCHSVFLLREWLSGHNSKGYHRWFSWVEGHAHVLRVMDSDSQSEKDDENDMDEPDPLERPKKRVHEHDNTRAQVRIIVLSRSKGGWTLLWQITNSKIMTPCWIRSLQKRPKTNGLSAAEKDKEGGQKRKRQAKVVIEEAYIRTEDLIGILSLTLASFELYTSSCNDCYTNCSHCIMSADTWQKDLNLTPSTRSKGTKLSDVWTDRLHMLILKAMRAKYFMNHLYTLLVNKMENWNVTFNTILFCKGLLFTGNSA